MRRYRDALKSFYDVVSNYPLSPKLSASTLKLGQTYTKLGDHEKARLMFDRVVEEYPDSPEAEVARKTIEAMVSTEDQTHSIAVGPGALDGNGSPPVTPPQ